LIFDGGEMLKHIKLVIFDLDGTLVDAYPAIIDSFNFTMRRLNLPQRDALTIRRAVGLGDGNLLKPYLNGVSVRTALGIYRKHHWKALVQKTRFLPGSKRILEYLKRRHFKLAIASNRPTKFSHIIIDHLKIRDYFDYVLCGDKLKRAKPYPDILRAILKRLSVKPAEAVYVGDMTVDVVTGRRARVKTVAVVTGSSAKKEITDLKPYRLIENIFLLNKIIK